METEIDGKLLEYINSEDFLINPFLTKVQKHVLIRKIKERFATYEISKELNLTSTQVRNIEKNSINKLKTYLIPKSPFMLIKDSLLSTRIINALSNDEEFEYLKDFDKASPYKLLRQNLGMKSIHEIQDYIKDLGLSLNFGNEKIKILNINFRKSLFAEFSDYDIIHWIYNLSELLKERQLKDKK